MSAPTTTLQLGDFTFARFEIPSSIGFGVGQKVNIHELIGGTRVIDVLGPSPKALRWSGWFVGENALARARYLQHLCAAGAPLALTWDELNYTVIIKAVDPDYRLGWRIPYSIECEVVSDNATPVTQLPQPSPEQAVTDDLATTQGLAASVGDNTLTGLVGALSSAVSDIGDFTSGSISQIAALVTPIAAARARISTLMVGTEAAVSAVAGVAGIVAGGDPIAMASALPGVLAAAQNMANLVPMDRTLARMAANVASAETGTSTLTVAGGNLFAVAAQEYGDARLWTVLASANGLSDPNISGVATLAIPPQPSPSISTGGVLNA